MSTFLLRQLIHLQFQLNKLFNWTNKVMKHRMMH